MPRHARVRTRNPQRHKREWARAFHSKERVEFVQSLPCIVPGCHFMPTQNAHSYTGGASRKAAYLTIVPLCLDDHRRQHDHGWSRVLGCTPAAASLILSACSAETQARWLAHRGEL